MQCPNCGGDLATSLVVEHELVDEQPTQVTAEGGVLICQECNMAVDPAATDHWPVAAPEDAESPAQPVAPAGTAEVQGDAPAQPDDAS